MRQIIISVNLAPKLMLPSNLYYKPHQIPKLKCFLSRLAVVFAQSVEARWLVENEDVVGAAPIGAYIRGLTLVHTCTVLRQTFTMICTQPMLFQLAKVSAFLVGFRHVCAIKRWRCRSVSGYMVFRLRVEMQTC